MEDIGSIQLIRDKPVHIPLVSGRNKATFLAPLPIISVLPRNTTCFEFAAQFNRKAEHGEESRILLILGKHEVQLPFVNFGVLMIRQFPQLKNPMEAG